jgi:site-specific recombinase XerD
MRATSGGSSSGIFSAVLPDSLHFCEKRHSAASLLIADGMPITAVSAMLGHALTSITLKVFAHVLPGADSSRQRQWSVS